MVVKIIKGLILKSKEAVLLQEGELMCKAGLHICWLFSLARSDVVHIEFDCWAASAASRL